jgi:hypothetical protein
LAICARLLLNTVSLHHPTDKQDSAKPVGPSQLEFPHTPSHFTFLLLHRSHAATTLSTLRRFSTCSTVMISSEVLSSEGNATERQAASEVRPPSVLASRHGNCRHKPSWNSVRIRKHAKTRCVLQPLVLSGQKRPRRLIRRGMFAPLSLGRRNRHLRRGCCRCGKVEWRGL